MDGSPEFPVNRAFNDESIYYRRRKQGIGSLALFNAICAGFSTYMAEFLVMTFTLISSSLSLYAELTWLALWVNPEV